MKNLCALLFFCLVITVSKAQIINIPDANLKAKLVSANPTNYIATTAGTVYIKIDTNNDGEIQVSEAQQVYGLSLDNDNISNLTGLSSFPNLQTLICSHNPLGSANFQNYNSLRYLNIQYCSLTSLNVNGSVSLMNLVCGSNLLTSFSLANLPNLIALSCDNNSMTSLTMSGLPNLQNLYIGHNQLTSFDFTGYNNLTIFNCIYNNFTTIDTSVRPNIHTKINCSYNPNLTSINIRDNYVGVDNGNWTQPKTSSPLGIPPPLTPPDLEFKGTPNMQNICVDAGEITYVQNKINLSGYTNPACQVSSTCEFLNLTTNTTTASACSSYTWAYNNQTYTASGTYTVVTGNHTEILNLTITPITSNTTTISACGAYTWSLNNQTYTTSGIYSVVTGCHTEILNLTINNSLITSQPLGPVLCTTVGSSATIGITTNVTTPQYTWQYRVITSTQPNPTWINITAANAGTVYSGYTSATLTIARTSTTLPKAGTQYRVMVSGGECGTVTSDTANLTIIGVVKAGTITSATSVCTGSDLTFTLGGYVGTSFQWQSALNTSGTFTDIIGATGNSYTATAMQSGSNRSYRVTVTNSACGTTATTAIRTITVNPLAVSGTITGGGLVCSGSSGTLKVMSYVGSIQWQYSIDGSSYSNVPIASNIPEGLPFSTTSTLGTKTTYLVTNITGNVYFKAKLTSGVCPSVYTNPVQYVIATEAIVGSISSANATICYGTATMLTLSNAIGTITWQKSTNYATATPTWYSIVNSNALSISTGNISYNTAYRAMVTIGSCSTVYSNLVYVTLVPKPLAKPISANNTNPSGLTAADALCIISPLKILSISSNTFVGTVQWQKSTESTTSGFADLSGSVGLSYMIQNATVGANYFRVKYSNSCGVAVYSNVITLYFEDCGSGKTAIQSPFTAMVYPNPYIENFAFRLSTSSEETVSVSIYDMTGKRVTKTEAKPIEIPQIEFGVGYPSGLYNVVITQGSEIKVLRIIKR